MKEKLNGYYFADAECYSKAYFLEHNIIKPYAMLLKGFSNGKILFKVNHKEFIKSLFNLNESAPLNNFYFTQSKRDKSLGKDNSGRSKRKYIYKAIIYFHNGGKYDLWFLLDYFRELKAEKYLKDWTYFADNKKNIFKIELTKEVNKRLIVIEFRDSYKLFSQPLKNLGKAVGLKKLDYGDYDIKTIFNNEEEYYQYENGKAYEYLNRDVDILITFFKRLQEHKINITDFKLTAASTAFAQFKKLQLNNYELVNNRNKFFNEKDWRLLKKAYRGGFTNVNVKYQMKVVNNIYKYDVNSLYPSVMEQEKIPYGQIYQGDKKGTTFKIYKLEIKKAIAKGIPFIEKETIGQEVNVNKTHQFENIDDFIELQEKNLTYPKILKNTIKYMSNYLLEQFEKYYEIEYFTPKKIVLSCYEMEDFFIEFIKKNKALKIKGKEINNKPLEAFGKLMLNSEYGKWAQKIDDSMTIFITKEELDKQKTINTKKQFFIINENGTRSALTKLSNKLFCYSKTEGVIKEKNFKYLPIAIKITEMSRIKLLKAIKEYENDVVYWDTDSVHILKEANTLDIHETRFGAWKFEGRVELGLYRRAKHYLNINVWMGNKLEEAYKLKGGGFNVNAFNLDIYGEEGSNYQGINIDTYKLNNFVVRGGKTFSMIIPGGVLIDSKDYVFSTPKRSFKEDLFCKIIG